MEVHRSLPQRALPMVGAWCFLDRFGPQTARMRVEPHPHIGLHTVPWPLVGEVRPLDGGPDAGGATATVVVGDFAGARSPATMHTPIVGAEIHVPAGSRVRLPLDPVWEYALVGVAGAPEVHTAPDAATALPDQGLLYLGIHRDGVEVSAQRETTLFLLGGEPFESDIVMWWNFVGRSHDEIVAAREAWESEADDTERADARFGHVIGHDRERVPAPPLPAVRLTPRRRTV